MSEPLYTTQILRLATETINWPPLDAPDRSVEQRAPLCGSVLKLDVKLDGHGRIAALGLKPQSCAMGQASATLFARQAMGKTLAEIAAVHDAMTAWLSGVSETLPDWPEIDQLTAARVYPARHGAMLLPFAAARAALAGDV